MQKTFNFNNHFKIVTCENLIEIIKDLCNSYDKL